MEKLIEKKPVSDHIRIEAFPAAKEKGDICVFGNIVGLSDYKTASGEPGSVDIGRPVAVFQAASADLDGAAPSIGGIVFVTPAGELTTTAAGNTPFGTIVQADAASFDFAVTG